MSETIGYDEVTAMIKAAAEKVRQKVQVLTELDSVTGDGDHGTAVTRSLGKAEGIIASADGQELQSVLKDIGWTILGEAGGATGPLLGSLFIGMSDAVEDKESLSASDVAEMFDTAAQSVLKRTKARPGDKTMIDALVPAVEAIKAAVGEGLGIAEALERGADAAEAGALSTVSLTAKYGRAKNFGQASIGSKDPGAASLALIFSGFSDAVKS